MPISNIRISYRTHSLQILLVNKISNALGLRSFGDSGNVI